MGARQLGATPPAATKVMENVGRSQLRSGNGILARASLRILLGPPVPSTPAGFVIHLE